MLAPVSNRGTALPNVAFVNCSVPVLISVVTHPGSATVPQRSPVKPLTQTQRHVSLLTTLIPPFWQGAEAGQSARLDGPVALAAACRWRGRTMSTTGTTIAAAMRIARSSIIMMKVHKDMPQQRRPLRGGWVLSDSCELRYDNR